MALMLHCGKKQITYVQHYGRELQIIRTLL